MDDDTDQAVPSPGDGRSGGGITSASSSRTSRPPWLRRRARLAREGETTDGGADRVNAPR
ncbi:hypothetical protein [Prauserella shujinwangii]|uniref:hypothetical protein n=1 Tax=Prauserella shujinwangii TaxID=1453103 RepID=UPI000D05A105|nr:hypothetical protein [Prauserella shujinwangii]